MKIIEKWNCKWIETEYTDNNPELLYKQRIRLECIESNNDVYKVGDTMTFAKTR